MIGKVTSDAQGANAKAKRGTDGTKMLRLQLKAKVQRSGFRLNNLPGLQPQPGQALLLAVGAIIIGTLLLGLLVEVGHIYITQRSLQNDADSSCGLRGDAVGHQRTKG